MESKNRGNKKPEPKSEELEFIYRHLEKLSDREILDELEDALNTKRTVGFIKRRRKEFEIAKRVLLGRLDDKYKQHMALLADCANNLVVILKKDWPYSEKDPIGITAVDCDDLDAVDFYVSPESKWLFSHLKPEIPQLKYLKRWDDLKASDISNELIGSLRCFAERKEFHGICEVCHDWVDTTENADM